MSIIVNGIELTEVIYADVNLDIVKVKKGTAEAVTVFEKITQLATPQNVSADGTTVSWDAVENATSYDVLADGASIGTVENESGETWVLNQKITSFPSEYGYIAVFVCASSIYIRIIRSTRVISAIDQRYAVTYTSKDNADIVVYDQKEGWVDSKYRTITFETAPTGDLLTWLQANATKQ